MKKTVRIVIETKAGFRFGYEKTITCDDKNEPLKLKRIVPENKKEIDTYA